MRSWWPRRWPSCCTCEWAAPACGRLAPVCYIAWLAEKLSADLSCAPVHLCIVPLGLEKLNAGSAPAGSGAHASNSRASCLLAQTRFAAAPPNDTTPCRHGAALGALGAKLDAKWLNTEGRVKLRLVWDRVR